MRKYAKVHRNHLRRFHSGSRVAFVDTTGQPLDRLGTVIAVVDDSLYKVAWDGVNYRIQKHILYDAVDLVGESELVYTADR